MERVFPQEVWIEETENQCHDVGPPIPYHAGGPLMYRTWQLETDPEKTRLAN